MAKQSASKLASKTKTPAKSMGGAGKDKFRFFHDKVSPWLSKGHVYGFDMHEEMTEPTILEGESAIHALAAVSTGTVLGICGGNRGHLFYYHPSFYVVDLGLLSGKPVTGGALTHTQKDIVVGGWHGEVGGAFRHDASRELGTGQEDFYARKFPIEFIKLPEKNEGVVAAAYHAPSAKTYLLTTARRIVSLADGAKRINVEATSETELAPALVILSDGSLLGAGQEGRLWRCRPGDKRVRPLDAVAPCEKGKRYVGSVQTLVLDDSGLVYGGTANGGFFFSFDPEADKIVNLGKPHRQSMIQGLTVGHDGLIYGITDEKDGIAHLFSFDPAARGFDDLGVINTFIPVQWAAYTIGAICTGIWGEIYLGEADNISHLFVYHPPVKRQILSGF